MEKEQIKIYCETMHKFYLDSANQSYKDYEQFKNYSSSSLPEFYLKNAKKYTDKADALLKVIEFINS